jgi:SAM-dependent methyltransferase
MTISKEEVLWCYRMILGREPESDAVVQARMTMKDLATLRKAFFHSPEFLKKRAALSGTRPPSPSLPLDLPENEIETEATTTQLAECLAKIKQAWTHLGAAKPHFSVLTNKQYLPENIDDNMEGFWASGEVEAARFERMLTHHGGINLSSKTCLEYGCGVGRVTMGLAKRFAQIHAYDISPEHLNLAKKRATELGHSNCTFHLCPDNPLHPLELCDFFYSRIVFQHNPPPVIKQLIRNALQALKPEGIAIFQVPTYRVNYRYSIDEWIATNHPLDMQMHCIPQQIIFSIIIDENCTLLKMREDNSPGSNLFISNIFIIRKN